MKSLPVDLGNVNLKGKKSKLLSCGCCEAYNFKEKELIKEMNKEIIAYTKGEEIIPNE